MSNKWEIQRRDPAIADKTRQWVTLHHCVTKLPISFTTKALAINWLKKWVRTQPPVFLGDLRVVNAYTVSALDTGGNTSPSPAVAPPKSTITMDLLNMPPIQGSASLMAGLAPALSTILGPSGSQLLIFTDTSIVPNKSYNMTAKWDFPVGLDRVNWGVSTVKAV